MDIDLPDTSYLRAAPCVTFWEVPVNKHWVSVLYDFEREHYPPTHARAYRIGDDPQWYRCVDRKVGTPSPMRLEAWQLMGKRYDNGVLFYEKRLTKRAMVYLAIHLIIETYGLTPT